VVARVTVADVAKAAGVSITTVSHSLSGKGRVEASTRERVRAVAAELGYVPSRTARNLALGRSDTIGLLLPQLPTMPLEELLAFDYYGRVAVAASQAALHHGRALLVLPGVQSTAQLRSFGLDGLIVLDPILDDPRLELLRGLPTRTVLMGQDPNGEFGPAVSIDAAGSTRALLDHCWERGARRIGMISPDLAWSATADSRDAYATWCSEHSIEPRLAIAPAASVQSRPDLSSAAKQTALDLLRAPDRPDALIGMLEDFGHGIVLAARELQLDVPGDLLVAQDIDDAVAAASGITALDLNVHTQLDIALAMLIADEPLPADEVRLVSATLVPRESTRGLAR
jgi:DNA-binding LacI/PurR family transcriptional regulator